MLYIIIPFLTAMALRSIFGPVLLGRLNDPLELLRHPRPSEGLTGFIVVGQEPQQKVLELLVRAMNTLRKTSLAQNTEEALHLIHSEGVVSKW